MILPPETLQCLYDKNIEIYEMIRSASTSEQKAELHAKHSLLKNILKTIRTRGIMTMDELDETMSPKKEYNFPLGQGQLLDMQAVALLKHLFYVASTDTELRKAGLDLVGNNQSLISDSEYLHVSNLLAKKLTERIEEFSRVLFDFTS